MMNKWQQLLDWYKKAKPYRNGDESDEVRTEANQRFFELAYELFPSFCPIEGVHKVCLLEAGTRYAILIDGPEEDAIRLTKALQPWLSSHLPVAFVFLGDANDIEFTPRDGIMQILGSNNISPLK